jgi:hypothetical protein
MNYRLIKHVPGDWFTTQRGRHRFARKYTIDMFMPNDEFALYTLGSQHLGSIIAIVWHIIFRFLCKHAHGLYTYSNDITTVASVVLKLSIPDIGDKYLGGMRIEKIKYTRRKSFFDFKVWLRFCQDDFAKQ